MRPADACYSKTAWGTAPVRGAHGARGSWGARGTWNMQTRVRRSKLELRGPMKDLKVGLRSSRG
eukprot:10375454-Alexandrium_andersonii.AAC.1